MSNGNNNKPEATFIRTQILFSGITVQRTGNPKDFGRPRPTEGNSRLNDQLVY
jgi:hypothetical protein